MKKCIKYLFILPLIPLLFSNTANAVNLSINVQPTGRTFEANDISCTYYTGASQETTGYCTVLHSSYNLLTNRNAFLTSITTTISDTVEGNYYKFYVLVRNDADGVENPLLWSVSVGDQFQFIDFKQVIHDRTDKLQNEFDCSNPDGRIGTSSFCYAPQVGSSISWFSSDSEYTNGFSTIYELTVKAQHSGYSVLPVNMSFRSLDEDNKWATVFLGTIYEFEPSTSDEIAQELKEQNDKDDQDRSDIESQSSDIDSDSDDSQQAAEGTGQTLLTAFTGFVTAITSARPSNCNLNMDMGNLDLGTVNFCQLSPPQEFQTLASIFLILFCVPLSIATARKVINLFRSFQG